MLKICKIIYSCTCICIYAYMAPSIIHYIFQIYINRNSYQNNFLSVGYKTLHKDENQKKIFSSPRFFFKILTIFYCFNVFCNVNVVFYLMPDLLWANLTLRKTKEYLKQSTLFKDKSWRRSKFFTFLFYREIVTWKRFKAEMRKFYF